MRVLLCAMLMTTVTLLLVPQAAAEGPETCVETVLATYSSGTGVILDGGEVLAVGARVGPNPVTPDGAGVVVLITLSNCKLTSP